MDIYSYELTIIVNGLYIGLFRARATTKQLVVGKIHQYIDPKFISSLSNCIQPDRPERARYNSIRKGWFLMDIYSYDLTIIVNVLHKGLFRARATTKQITVGKTHWYIAPKLISSLSNCIQPERPVWARYNSIRKVWRLMDIYSYNLNIIMKGLHKALF